eukprot:CAMPEP_0204256076 /NCGR_PEP_ID=MMETSP0468-20130131/3565_1 /ASSEMBLY_ACC=CAM_ASM_000383 /TAXON_ID=2969 /ORGANISM="Oxyrrhis marina" /LENGTH=134 /DNA_ID=CAMNT_0051230003 /DNA_START=327 /DNA_END=731 /DNA_ORIENTATION=+
MANQPLNVCACPSTLRATHILAILEGILQGKKRSSVGMVQVQCFAQVKRVVGRPGQQPLSHMSREPGSILKALVTPVAAPRQLCGDGQRRQKGDGQAVLGHLGFREVGAQKTLQSANPAVSKHLLHQSITNQGW